MISCPERLRRPVFRLGAVVLGLLPFVAAEGVLRLSDWGSPSEVEDPYIGFTGLKTLFELNRATGRYEIPVSRQALFRAESFAALKGDNEFRIFCLGGSTVQGRPYAIETSFTTWLELSLRSAEPERQWQVVNCGGVSYASYRLMPILRELLQHKPDLFILYTGHNEFLEDRTYHTVKRTPPLLAIIHSAMSNCRIYNMLRSIWLHSSGQLDSRPQLAADADPRLDYRGGLESYHRDDTWRDATIEHFRFSLRRMLRLAADAKIPVLMCDPVANLKDVPPFKTVASDGLTPRQRAKLKRLLEAADAVDITPDHGDRLLNEVLAIDPRHAGAQYRLGRLNLELGQNDRAKAAFLQAKDNDICPLRILEPMHQVIVEVAAEGQVPLIDIRRSVETRSPAGIPGREWLVDHVHPTIEGHQLIAAEIMRELERIRIVQPRAGWESKRKIMYRAHQAALPPSYFSDAENRIQGLRRWTSGRAFQTE